MSEPGAVDAVVFDWGGTLTPWHDIDLRRQWVVYAQAYDPAHGDEVAEALLAAEEEARGRARTDHRSATFDTIVRTAGLRPSGPAHDRALAAYRAFWEPHTWTDADVVPLLRALRELGLRVGVLSNTVWPRD